MSLYEGAQARVKVNGELSLLFELLRGILQGDTTAPYLFIIVADYILRRALALHPEVAFILEGNTTGPRTRSRAQREQGNGLRETGGLYADDLFVMSGGDGRLDGYVQSLTELLEGLQRLAEEVELKFNTDKCDILSVVSGRIEPAGQEKIEILRGEKLKTVTEFKYLGSLLSSTKNDVKKRFGQAWAACKIGRKYWINKLVPIQLKITVFKAIVVSMCTYGAPGWVLLPAFHAP
jgi:hypothetical protein